MSRNRKEEKELTTRRSGETELQTEGTASAKAPRLKLTKQALGTAPLQLCKEGGQATVSPSTEGKLRP